MVEQAAEREKLPGEGWCNKHNRFFTLTEGCPECLVQKEGIIMKQAYPGISDDNKPVMKLEIEPNETIALIKIKPDDDSKVIALYEESQKLLDYAESREIKVDEDLKLATDDLTLMSNMKKAIEELRKEYTVPINEHLKSINEAFKKFTAPLLQADEITRKKMLAYNKKQEEIRAEQERINKLRMEAAKAEMELTGELSESVELVDVQPEAPKTTKTDIGTSGMVDQWKAEVTDFSILPDEYKLPNMQMLNAAARTYKDKRQIPGVRFYNEPILKVRAKKEE